MSRAFLLLILIFGNVCSFGQTLPTVISGTAPEYAGYQIELQKETDPVTHQSETVGVMQVLPDGSFSTTVKLPQTSFCTATFDRWEAELYLEPGNNYEIVLPPFEPLSEAEKQNPFFQLQAISLGIKNQNARDINTLIRQFENTFNLTENEYFNQIFKDKSQAAADSLINKLKGKFPKTANSYFEEYKSYRYASIQFAVNQNKTNTFVKEYLDRPPFNFNLPPFSQLFEQQFSNYFNVESNQIGGEEFRVLAGTANLKGLEDYFRNKKGWSEKLSRTVILKGINDAFYQRTFGQQSMLALLDKIQQNNWTDNDKRLAKKLAEKLRYLLPGTDAPNISMTNFDGKKLDLSDWKGKLVYLHFTTITNPICRQQLDELNKIAQQFNKQLEIINLLPEANIAKKELILQQNWAGTFCTVTDAQKERYKVKTFPTSFLIEENGKLIGSPASNPLDGLSYELGNYFKEKQMKRFRYQAK